MWTEGHQNSIQGVFILLVKALSESQWVFSLQILIFLILVSLHSTSCRTLCQLKEWFNDCWVNSPSLSCTIHCVILSYLFIRIHDIYFQYYMEEIWNSVMKDLRTLKQTPHSHWSKFKEHTWYKWTLMFYIKIKKNYLQLFLSLTQSPVYANEQIYEDSSLASDRSFHFI